MPGPVLSTLHFITEVRGEKEFESRLFSSKPAYCYVCILVPLRLVFVHGKHYSEVVSCLKQLVFNVLKLQIHKT